MLDWRMRGLSANRGRENSIGGAAADGATAGEYRPLFKYLRDRYANRVVLTFAEIEDLVGFALPADALAEPGWWHRASDAGRQSTQSAAWTHAGRSATVNLVARTVVFDRKDA